MRYSPWTATPSGNTNGHGAGRSASRTPGMRQLQIPSSNSQAGAGRRSRGFATPAVGHSRSSATPRRPRSTRGGNTSTVRVARPGTASSSNTHTGTAAAAAASASAESDGPVLLAVTENSAREVGLAMLRLSRPELVLMQYADTASYSTTLTAIMVHDVSQVLMHSSSADSQLHRVLAARLPQASVSMIARRYFSEASGAVVLQQHMVPGLEQQQDTLSHHKYLAHAAAAALLKYIEFQHGIAFASATLRVVHRGVAGHMMIDSRSIEALELVAPRRSEYGRADEQRQACLLAVLNHCRTANGRRLLRSNLLQPITDQATLQLRQDCLGVMLQDPPALLALSNALSSVPDVDRMLRLLSHVVPRQEARRDALIRAAADRITGMIQLQDSLRALPGLLEPLARIGEHPLVAALRENLQHAGFERMHARVSQVLDREATWSRGALQLRTQQCFAVRPGIHAMLDVARQTYSETIEEMHQLEQRLARQHDLPRIKLAWNSGRGYHLTLPVTGAEPEQREFLRVSRTRKSWIFTTAELSSLNDRNTESLHEILSMTAVVIDDLLDQLRPEIGALFVLSESVSLLDMLASMAHAAHLGNWTCPTIKPDVPTAIQRGRHPILQALASGTGADIVANDAYLDASCNMQVITGPNMSGKTTYLSQHALLTVMAHVGSYVPAAFASIRTTDRLFTRLGDDDDLHHSSFSLEMSECATILADVTPASLVVIDELGRGTAPTDGIGLSWAIAEALAATSAHVLFTTHYAALAKLKDLLPNVRPLHLTVDTSSPGSSMRFTFELGRGVGDDARYGLALARRVWPHDVVVTAEHAMDLMQQREHRTRADAPARDAAHAELATAHRLFNVCKSTLPESGKREFLSTIMREHDQVLE